MLEAHLPDQVLLQAADGELEPAREVEVRRHLAACWSCRARLQEIERTIAEFVRAHQESFQAPPGDGPRALLRARMAELAGPVRPVWRELLASHRWAVAGAALAVAAAALLLNPFRPARPAPLVPDPRLTPGATVPVSTADVCQQQRPIQASFIPASVGREVFARYGIGNPPPRAYELDYLIAPELGGADDPRNFWPQPYSSAVWNAHLKDALEDHLHRLVCENKLSLEQAQRDLATDWIAAYKKYFQTQQPIASHAAFRKDRPWME